MIEGQKLKSFWNKPEGTTGMVVPAILVGVVIYFWSKIAPWLLSMVQTTLNLVIALVILAGILFILTDKRMRILVGNIYKTLMRAITRAFISIDPISVMKNYVDRLKVTQEQIIKHINNLRGVIKGLQSNIASNDEEKEHLLGLSSQARKQDQQALVALKAKQASTLAKSNITLNKLLTKLELLLRVLLKMKDTSALYIDDIEFKVKTAEAERKAITAGYSAMKKITKALLGDEQKAMFDEALEVAAEDYNMKIGEMEGFIDMTKDIINASDLEQGVALENGIRLLEEWEQKNVSTIINPEEKQKLIAAANDQSNILDLNSLDLGNSKEAMKVNKFNKYL